MFVRGSDGHVYSALLLQQSTPPATHTLFSLIFNLSSLFLHLQMFARGSEGHVYSALLLQQAYSARIQELDGKVAAMPRKTQAMQRRLTQQINELISGANVANAIYSEAVPCRCVRWGEGECPCMCFWAKRARRHAVTADQADQ
jgi:hypothetical protein